MIGYFTGMLVIASVLAAREYLFFIFLITGFFHATVLRPWPLVIIGVFATSVLINTLIAGFPNTTEWWSIWVAIIVIQTLAIGGGGMLGERLAEAQPAAAPRRWPGLEAVARGERRPARPVADARPRGRRARRAAAHGGRDPRTSIAQGLTGIVNAASRPAEQAP